MPIFLWLRTSTPREAPKLEHLSNSARNDEYDSAFPVLFLLELKISEPLCRICKSTNLHRDLLRRPVTGSSAFTGISIGLRPLWWP